jgi:hypothetical protein
LRGRLRRGRIIFAANLAQLDDVEVWAYDVRGPRGAINANGCSCRAPGMSMGGCARRRTPVSCRTDFGIVAEGDAHTRARSRRDTHAFAGSRLLGAERGRERRRSRSTPRIDPRTTFPTGKIPEPGPQWDVKGDTTPGPYEPKPASMDAIEALSPTHTRGGMPTLRSRTRGARSGAR